MLSTISLLPLTITGHAEGERQITQDSCRGSVFPFVTALSCSQCRKDSIASVLFMASAYWTVCEGVCKSLMKSGICHSDTQACFDGELSSRYFVTSHVSLYWSVYHLKAF